MDLRDVFRQGKKTILILAIVGLAADLLANTGYAEYSVIGLPVELAVLAYFSHGFARGKGLAETVAGTLLVGNCGILLDMLILSIILLAASAAGFMAESPDMLIKDILDNVFLVIGIFSSISVIIGAIMWALVNRMGR